MRLDLVRASVRADEEAAGEAHAVARMNFDVFHVM
jgi:hypothetical protein